MAIVTFKIPEEYLASDKNCPVRILLNEMGADFNSDFIKLNNTDSECVLTVNAKEDRPEVVGSLAQLIAQADYQDVYHKELDKLRDFLTKDAPISAVTFARLIMAATWSDFDVSKSIEVSMVYVNDEGNFVDMEMYKMVNPNKEVEQIHVLEEGVKVLRKCYA